MRYLPGQWSAVATSDISVFVSADTPTDSVMRLWELCESGAKFTEALQAIIAELGPSLTQMAPFSLVTLDGDVAHIAVRGPLRVVALTEDGRVEANGEDVVTWRESKVSGVQALSIIAENQGPGDGSAMSQGDGSAATLPIVGGVILVSRLDQVGALDQVDQVDQVGRSDQSGALHGTSGTERTGGVEPDTGQTQNPGVDKEKQGNASASVPVGPTVSGAPGSDPATPSGMSTPESPALSVTPPGSVPGSAVTPPGPVPGSAVTPATPSPTPDMPGDALSASGVPVVGSSLPGASEGSAVPPSGPLSVPATPGVPGVVPTPPMPAGAPIAPGAAPTAPVPPGSPVGPPPPVVPTPPEVHTGQTTLMPSDEDEEESLHSTTFFAGLWDEGPGTPTPGTSTPGTSTPGIPAPVAAPMAPAPGISPLVASPPLAGVSGPGMITPGMPWQSAAPGAPTPPPPGAYPADDHDGMTVLGLEEHDGMTVLGLDDHDDHDGMTVLEIPQVPRPTGPIPPPPPPPTGPVVLARVCGNCRAPNSTRRTTCRACGAPLSGDAVRIPRPSLGMLTLPSGEQMSIEHPVIVGRRPEAARFSHDDIPVVVKVNDPHVSSTHLKIDLEDWSVLVTNLGRNGTVLRRPGQPDRMLGDGEQVLAEAGDVYCLGEGIDLTVVRLS